jgi:Tol biopolymer transport system component
VIETGEKRLDFLMKKPVDGALLADQLRLGGLSAELALQYAIEVGEAIAAAHARGLVHGSISPDSVVITAGGARLLEPLASSGAPNDAHRSPEQARGESPDSRSDVFAFGILLQGMLTGWRGTRGSSPGSPQSILLNPQAMLAGRSMMQACLDKVIAACIEPDPARRRQTIRHAVLELKLRRCTSQVAAVRDRESLTLARNRLLAAAGMVPVNSVGSAKPVARLPIWAGFLPVGSPLNPVSLRYGIGVLSIALFVLASSALAAVFLLRQKPAAPVLKFAVAAPEKTTYSGFPSISPDGKYLAFSAIGPEGHRTLWLRPLDALHADLIPGTEGGSQPFWSPDSQFIGFFADNSLKKVPVAEGLPEAVCPLGAMPAGGAWNPAGTIVFSAGLGEGLYTVPASGGSPQHLLTPDPSKGERSFLWPQFLPDGRHLVFFDQTDTAETTGIHVGRVDNQEHHLVFRSETSAVYTGVEGEARNGYLLFVRGRSLMGLRLNVSRFEAEGDPITLVEDVNAGKSLSFAPVSVSNNSVLAYQSAGQTARQMVWLDRSGRQLGVSGEPGEYGPPRLSPDGHRAAVAKLRPDGRGSDIRIVDVNGSTSPFSAAAPVNETSPVWSPDGSRLAFAENRGGVDDLYVRPVNAGGGAREELLFKNGFSKYPVDWSREGRTVLFLVSGKGTMPGIWSITPGTGHASLIEDSSRSDVNAALSPDGKWLAYQSDESGRSEVYVQPNDGAALARKRRRQISADGGGLPRWRGDGAEIFYITVSGRLTSVAVRGMSGNSEFGAPQPLFQTQTVPGVWNPFDTSPDGQHFVMSLPLEWSPFSPVTVVTNWTAKLKD